MKRSELRRTDSLKRATPLRPRSRKKERAQRAWQTVKAQVYERDGYRCQRCAVTSLHAPLDVHHRLTRGRGGKDTVGNCVTLCRWCHSHVHANPAEAERDGWLTPSWAVSA